MRTASPARAAASRSVWAARRHASEHHTRRLPRLGPSNSSSFVLHRGHHPRAPSGLPKIFVTTNSYRFESLVQEV